MASKLRTPALVVAGICALLVVLVELGGGFRASGDAWASLGSLGDQIEQAYHDFMSDDGGSHNDVDGFGGLEDLLKTKGEDPPGYAIAALAWLDGLLLFTLILFNLPLVMNQRVLAQLQGVATIIMAIVALLMSLLILIKSLVMLFLMLGMLLALPFGTILYMILYAFFDTSEAAAILGTVFTLKIICGIALIVAHEKFLKNIGFILLLGTCILAGIIVSFLHSFPPGFLVSITDAVAAIICCILTLIWSLVLLIGGIIAVIKVILALNTVAE